MNKITDDNLINVLNKIATKCGLESWSYEKKQFENIAQNYFGVIIPVTLQGKKEGKDSYLEVVLKLAPTDERFRVSGAVTSFFAREIFVYANVLPKYRQFQNKTKALSDFVIPELYFLENDYGKEAIAMQNMTVDGFLPFVKDFALDIDHMALSMKCLAHFHAMSFILNTEDPHLYETAQKACAPLSRLENERFMTILLDRIDKAIDTLTNTKYTFLLDKLRDGCDEFVEAVYKSVNSTVLCHGDIWKENLLFKYEDRRPTLVCMIDYQTTRVASPAFDVLFLIVTSTESNLRKDHYYQLLEIYYEAFEHTLKEAKLLVKEVYSREMFDKDLDIVGPACFIIANTAIWLSSGLQQEGHVRSKIVLETEEQKTIAIEKYKNRVRNVLDDLTSYGYFKDLVS